MRKRKKKDHHMAHPDEKWLVSYSDLMTLLFGFFVLMFSIASEKTGHSELMGQISQSFSSQDPAKIDTPPKQVSLEEFEKIKQELEQKNDEVSKIKNQVLLNQENIDKIEQLRISLNAREKEFELTKAELELKNKTYTDIEKSKKLIELENKQLSKNMVDIDKNNKKLKDEIESLKNSGLAKTNMMFFAKWETEKHDIDLRVTNPNGNVFNFKNRSFPKTPGELILDSRYGPGAEIWNSTELIPGNYSIQLFLYNQYGNKTPAKIQLTLMVGLNRVKLDNIELTSDKNLIDYKINIDENGKIKILK